MRSLVVIRFSCALLGVLSIFAFTGCSVFQHVICQLQGASHFDWDTGYCVFPPGKSAAVSAGDALFVSATAHVAGAQGTNWRTDLQVHNLADEQAAVRMTMLMHGADNTDAEYADFSLAPGESLRLGDVLAGEFGVDEGLAALVLRPGSGRILVTSRTYNLLGEGNQLGLPAGSTFGQFIPAVPMRDAIRFGEEGRLVQLSHNRSSGSGFRTNLGVVNATNYSCRIEIELYGDNGVLLGSIPVNLPPLGYRQFNRVFASVTGGDVNDGYAVVRTSTAGGTFFAYASVVDNLTGDPVAVSAVRLPGDGPRGVGDPIYVAASAHVAGAAGTNWRTDLEVHCFSDGAASYTIELLKHGTNNSDPRSESFILGAGESMRFEDILDDVFSFEGAAALRITPATGRVLVTSRTYNLLGSGNDLGLPAGATFGQYIPGLTTAEAVGFGEQSRLIQLSRSTDDERGFRTNLVLVNATGDRIDVEIGLYRANGVLLGTLRRSLAPYEYRQLNRVFGDVTAGNVEDGYALVSTTTEGGKFFTLASVVDNSTGDPVGMSGPVILPENAGAVLDEVEAMMTMFGQTDLESFVNNLQDLGVDEIFDALVAAQGDVSSRTATGMVIDYGDGWLLPDGSIYSGAIDVDASGLSIGSGGIFGPVAITQDSFMIDGEPAGVGSSRWAFALTERNDGTVAGEVTIQALGGPKSSDSIIGTVGIDTAICLEYPISGSLTVVVRGEEITITFSPDCDGSVTHETSGSPPEAFNFSFGSPASAEGLNYVASTSNAEIAQEGVYWYWRPTVGAETLNETEPGVVTFHFPFDRPVASGRLVVKVTTFQWSYSRGQIYLYGSGDGADWHLLSEVGPPDFGGYNSGGWTDDLPEMFIGESDIWLEVRLFAYGPTADVGGVRCNTAQLSRWQEGSAGNSFELEVELE